jgi:hypothetical protein
MNPSGTCVLVMVDVATIVDRPWAKHIGDLAWLHLLHGNVEALRDFVVAYTETLLSIMACHARIVLPRTVCLEPFVVY